MIRTSHASFYVDNNKSVKGWAVIFVEVPLPNMCWHISCRDKFIEMNLKILFFTPYLKRSYLLVFGNVIN